MKRGYGGWDWIKHEPYVKHLAEKEIQKMRKAIYVSFPTTTKIAASISGAFYKICTIRRNK